MKIKKHTNWNYFNCKCWNDNSDPYSEPDEELKKLHEEYVYFQSHVRDLLQSLDAEQQLKNGFKGMGHNILTESAGKRHMYIRKLKELLSDD